MNHDYRQYSRVAGVKVWESSLSGGRYFRVIPYDKLSYERIRGLLRMRYTNRRILLESHANYGFILAELFAHCRGGLSKC